MKNIEIIKNQIDEKKEKGFVIIDVMTNTNSYYINSETKKNEHDIKRALVFKKEIEAKSFCEEKEWCSYDEGYFLVEDVVEEEFIKQVEENDELLDFLIEKKVEIIYEMK